MNSDLLLPIRTILSFQSAAWNLLPSTCATRCHKVLLAQGSNPGSMSILESPRGYLRPPSYFTCDSVWPFKNYQTSQLCIGNHVHKHFCFKRSHWLTNNCLKSLMTGTVDEFPDFFPGNHQERTTWISGTWETYAFNLGCTYWGISKLCC